MPRQLKFWLALVVSIAAAIFAAFLYNRAYGLGLALAFVQSEVAIAWWLGMGLSAPKALVLAIACIVVDVTNWFLIAQCFESWFGKLIARKIVKYPRLRVFLERIKSLSYLAIFILCFWPPIPGQIPIGVSFACFWPPVPGQAPIGTSFTKGLGLNKYASFVVIVFGHSLKAFIWTVGLDTLKNLVLQLL